MDIFTILFTISLLIVNSFQIPMENLEDVLVYPIEAPTNIQKRDTTRNNQIDSSTAEFIEEKLIQHSKALEHLVEMVQANEDLTKQLIDSLSKRIEKPEMPEKVDVDLSRRSMINEETKAPTLKFTEKMYRFGTLLKNMIWKEIKDDPEPTPLVEEDSIDLNSEFLSRRSFGGTPVPVPSLQTNTSISPWCSVAVFCRRTLDPVCGYDENFGYGKFDDICHMLQVNCFWKYNFALVPSCKPTS